MNKFALFAIFALCNLYMTSALVKEDALGTFLVLYDTCNATCGYSSAQMILQNKTGEDTLLNITGTLTGNCTGKIDATEYCTYTNTTLGADLTCTKLG
jgi:hypothetical protein